MEYRTIESICKEIGINEMSLDQFCCTFLGFHYSQFSFVGPIANTGKWKEQAYGIFYDFIISKKEIVKDFHDDFYSQKTPEYIANKIQRPIEKINKILKSYHKSYIEKKFINSSSFGIREGIDKISYLYLIQRNKNEGIISIDKELTPLSNEYTIGKIYKDVGCIYQEVIRKFCYAFKMPMEKYFIGPPNRFVSYQIVAKEFYDLCLSKKQAIIDFGNKIYGVVKVKQQITNKIEESSETNDQIKDIPVERNKIIGYDDIKEDILDQLESVINSDDAENWGLKKPGGILLFGPPGCGKTHWANWLAKFLKYEFQEVPRSLFGSTFVDGAMLNLKKLLNEIKEKSRLILFFDEFDSVASVRNKGGSSSNENDKVVNTLLQEIPKLIENDIIIVAASNFLESLDPAVIRPGRFDLKLPIFPPTPEERIKLLIHTLSNGLKRNSPLLNILYYNEVLDEKFWLSYSEEMELFSNSLVIDTSEIIKKKIKKFYAENGKKTEIKIPEQLIKEAINDASAKFTKRDAEFISNFYNEVKALGKNVYNKRTGLIFKELSNYYKRFKDPPKPIGFRKPDLGL